MHSLSHPTTYFGTDGGLSMLHQPQNGTIATKSCRQVLQSSQSCTIFVADAGCDWPSGSISI